MLKKKRIRNKLTELELAKKIGISEGYISKLEKHPKLCNPTVNLILKLSKELKLNPVKLFIYFIQDKKDHDN
ncbi:helix-turn-helix domain-containing protein [Clostridium beijerinckii]|uniref:helix-turn-helix domain-containing protein n=1 Tax=Clostridium beijerinckii TaxID=1520 RepID=UPI0022263946|nr:helix-turn-helix transcriptional regulator [Clostridium beijerinckii]UYZ37299.1 helix-turn-helix domain-containing protein [Clostridium beijerinckii]